ncbi:class I SAM-dependent methyltransferase [Marinobacter sp. JSM 1782161]|uniref:class I SAM-dependent methyltransferase n=1 Tax=Marinobacter sp. JSM 1782161 TaxID=2685906 RepID=UPI0014033D10|nr:class I SAM-dependent methyltransferase [Marinobacter sp. JSM 1782161]
MINTHDVLLRNRESLSGRVALIGPDDAAILADLPVEPGPVITEHFGTFQRWQGLQGWTPLFGYDDDALAGDSVDSVVIFMPKSRPELELRLALAGHLAKAGGRVFLIGEKKEGIAGGARVMQFTFPDATKIDSARHCQVWEAPVPAGLSGFDIDAWRSWHKVRVGGLELSVAGLPGIFSDGRLDEGTALLLGSFNGQAVRGPVLDFACGAGVIGAWLAKRQDGLNPDAVDVQYQAVDCARATYARAGVGGRVWASDGLAAVEDSYRLLVSNPPFHSGVRTDTSMTEAFLRDAARHLLPGGELRIVANSFLPYPELIERHVGPCETLGEDKRFSVYRAFRR